MERENGTLNMKKTKAYITDYNIITPLGFDVESNWDSIQQGKTGIKKHQIIDGQPEFLASKIDEGELNNKFKISFENQNFTKLEKMLLLALKPLVENHKIHEKSLLILSTTKGNIDLLKNKTQVPQEAFLSVLAQKIADYFDFKMKPIVVSNACVSGVMAASVSKKLLESGCCEDAFVIAGDLVSEFVMAGFNSFQALSETPCKPYDKNRNGISIGEAAAAAYITKTSLTENFSFKIIGESSINDANHISGPSRTGEGLYQSIENALQEANLKPENIDFLSAHGTATLYNDEMEAIAFNRSGLQNTPMNSLKGYYGHCLGASGLLELIIAMESAKRNQLVVSKYFEESGTSVPINVIKDNKVQTISTFMKTASGFGGCNSVVILQKTKPHEED